MKIITIFTNRLFTFHYKNNKENELRRLLSLWSDAGYVFQFLMANAKDLPHGITIPQLAKEIIKDANKLDQILNELSLNKGKKLEHFFKPLDNSEYQQQALSKQKGRINYLRLYALKIDENMFVITGGAIKFTHLMKDRQHTQDELYKIGCCKQYLKENSVTDSESLFEFIND